MIEEILNPTQLNIKETIRDVIFKAFKTVDINSECI